MTVRRAILTIICGLCLALQVACSPSNATAPPLPWKGATRIILPAQYYYPRFPALSPNGEQLAVLGAVAFDNLRGYVMLWDNTSKKLTPIELGDSDYTVTYLSWDSTSTQLLFGASDIQTIYNVTSGVAEPLSAGSERFTAIGGPGENQITKYIRKPAQDDTDQNKRLEVLNLDDNSEEYLFALDWVDPSTDSGADWSSDGKQLIFSIKEQSSEKNSSTLDRDIFVFDRQTREISTLVNTSADEVEPHWSPDGQWFVYLADQSGEAGSELVISSVDGTCVIREPVDALLMYVDWGLADQLAVVYSNALFLIDMREAFGFGMDDLADHCENP